MITCHTTYLLLEFIVGLVDREVVELPLETTHDAGDFALLEVVLREALVVVDGRAGEEEVVKKQLGRRIGKGRPAAFKVFCRKL